MEFSQERIDEFKKATKDAHNKEITDEEALKGLRQLESLADIFFNMWLEDRKKRSQK